jgi:hypothetical protein
MENLRKAETLGVLAHGNDYEEHMRQSENDPIDLYE